MSNIALWKQEKRDFIKQLHNDGELVTIKYYLKRPGITNDKWEKTDGVMWQYTNVLCLKEIISELTHADNGVANVQLSKTNFRFQYQGYDFHGNNKKYFQIVDSNGKTYEIDEIKPIRKMGNTYLAWIGIQK